MVYLKLFGSPSLLRDEVVLTGRAAQRHRLALLALLVLAPGRRMSRDKVIAYLWPERDGDAGRNLLKVSTYVLRAELAETALVSEGDDVRLDPDVVRSDVSEFADAIARADYSRAVE